MSDDFLDEMWFRHEGWVLHVGALSLNLLSLECPWGEVVFDKHVHMVAPGFGKRFQHMEHLVHVHDKMGFSLWYMSALQNKGFVSVIITKQVKQAPIPIRVNMLQDPAVDAVFQKDDAVLVFSRVADPGFLFRYGQCRVTAITTRPDTPDRVFTEDGVRIRAVLFKLVLDNPGSHSFFFFFTEQKKILGGK